MFSRKDFNILALAAIALLGSCTSPQDKVVEPVNELKSYPGIYGMEDIISDIRKKPVKVHWAF